MGESFIRRSREREGMLGKLPSSFFKQGKAWCYKRLNNKTVNKIIPSGINFLLFQSSDAFLFITFSLVKGGGIGLLSIKA
jgi:hypothetical protein